MKPLLSSNPSPSIANESWLSDARWSSNTLHSKLGKHWLTLKTQPGVVGGSFAAYIDGLKRDYYGQAQVTITSTITESSRDHNRTPFAVAVTDFLEVESVTVSGPRVDFAFTIPFEATCLSDGAVWTLWIEFGNGVSELFEIPVYRTQASDPTLTYLKLASISSTEIAVNKTQPVTENKPSYSLSIDEKLIIKIPAKVTGKPGLFKGLAIFSGLWAVVGIAFIIIAGLKDFPWFFFIPIPVMALFLLFLYKGISSIEMDDKELKIKHSLFGIGLPFTINKNSVAGFSYRCLGSMPSDTGPQAAYLLAVKTNENGLKILTPALMSQWDSRVLIKRLSEYWGIKP